MLELQLAKKGNLYHPYIESASALTNTFTFMQKVGELTYLKELLLQLMYLIFHCSDLCLLQPTGCVGGGQSKVKGCVSCVVLPALVQANHLGLEYREGVKVQQRRGQSSKEVKVQAEVSKWKYPCMCFILQMYIMLPYVL